MPNNILEEYNATSEQRIDDKTEIYSVTTKDVGLTVREGVELALLYPQADIVKTYPKDFITRDVAYNLFISLQNNVSGDTANGANWQPLSSNASQSVYDLGVISDDFANGYEATVPPIASYSTSNIYLFKPDNTNTGASTLQINALAVLPIKKYISGAIANVAAGDLNLANTYLLIYKTTYFLIASVSSGGGGVSTFSALTDSPYDNTLLAEALDSKQDKPNGVLTGCTITLGSFPLGKNVRITEGTWRISPREYGNVGSGDTDFLVALSASGLQRYVELVGTGLNTIIKVEGAENAIAVRPTLGVGQTSLGSILVKDALIDPPVPDLSGYVPLTGTPSMTGDFSTPQIGDYRGTFRLNYANSSLQQSYTNGFNAIEIGSFVVRLSAYNNSNSARTRQLYFAENAPYIFVKDILKLEGISHVDIATKLNAEPYGLITKQYASDTFIPKSGTTELTGDIFRTGDGESYFGTKNGSNISWLDTYVDGSIRILETIVATIGNSSSGTFVQSGTDHAVWSAGVQGTIGDRIFSFALNQPFLLTGAEIAYDVDRTTEINANSLALINRAYADDNYGNVIQKEFTLDFDATEDTFEKTHNYYNDYITYSIRKADGSYYKETEYDVRSTTTTFTVAFVTPPAAGTGKLTLQSVQKEAPSGGGGIGTGIIGSTFIVG